MISPGRKLLGILFLLSLALIAAFAVWSRLHEPRAEGKPLSHWIRHLRIGVRVLHHPHPDGAFIVRTFTVMLPNLTDQELSSLTISTNVRTIARNTGMVRCFPNS